MSNRLLIKKSSVVSKVPLVTDLEYGELALNYADGKLYYKDSTGTSVKYFPSSDVISGGIAVETSIARTFMMMGA